jgi:hypothetical protein
MRQIIGMTVATSPVWGVIVAASVLGEWWYGPVMVAGLAAVSGVTVLGLWIAEGS